MANPSAHSISILFLFLLLSSPISAICVPRNASLHDQPPTSLSTPDSPPLESSLPASGSSSGGPFVSGNLGILDRVCGSTDYKLLCMSTLAPVIRDKSTSGAPPTTKSILQVAINVAMAETKLAMNVIDGLIKQTADENAKSALGDCTDSYNDALDNFQAAWDAIGNWDLGTINSMLSASITSFSDCDDELTGIVTDFAGHGQKLTQMTSNCLAIASVVR